MTSAKNQLQGETYSRMLLYLTLPVSGDETYHFTDKILEIARSYYPDEDVFLAGNSTNEYDFEKSFAVDNTVVSIVSVLIVLVVLLFTFNSAGMPVLLILVIQGCIWLNFSFPTITGKYIFFLGYLIVSSIQMGANIEISEEYFSYNGRTRLVDILVKKSKLHAAKDKLHALPFPGINMDNLPFLGLIATVAEGRTLVHDWSYENRAIYFTELSKLNAQIELVDPHRVYITGPTRWKPADAVAPPALRPSVVVMIAMLAAPGVSTLRDVYNINRGYEDFAERLNSLGAKIETLVV